MDPDVAKQWVRIFRDIAIVFIGVFMLVYETVFRHEADWEIVAAALTCFGLPPALRFDWTRDEDKKQPRRGAKK